MALTSLIGQLLLDVQSQIQALALTGLDSANVVVLPIPMDDSYKLVPSLPAVVVCPFGIETISDGTTLSDDIGYPILVGILQKSSVVEEAADPVAELDKYLFWREAMIDDQIHNRASTNLAPNTLINKQLELNSIVNLESYLQADMFISSFVVRCTVHIARRT